MPPLIHLIYASAETRPLNSTELADLLAKSRANNARFGITGILLHAEGSFFQVLEGPSEAVECLFERISRDPRHTNLTIIIREPIAQRAFGEWTMGFFDVQTRDIQEIMGVNDLFGAATYLSKISPGRAKKLLEAFKQGRWRSRLTIGTEETRPTPPEIVRTPGKPFTFAFQPIVDVVQQRVVSYEALLRGGNNEPAGKVLKQVPPEMMASFDETLRGEAVQMAARLGLDCSINLNFLPKNIETTHNSLCQTLQTAKQHGISADRIVLEIVESEIIHDLARFVENVNTCRYTGIRVAIDDFGAGYAGLNLLADFQPDLIKLDMHLVRDIDKKGPRQAIARGIIRTCMDLGIDIIAEGVERVGEYCWLRDEGISLFQGRLFAAPGFERLPGVVYPPARGEKA